MPKESPTYQSSPILSRPFKLLAKNNFMTVREQPIIASELSYGQSTPVDTQQRTLEQYSQPSQYSFVPQQKTLPTFISRPHKLHKFIRVLQPEMTKTWNTQSAYRR